MASAPPACPSCGTVLTQMPKATSVCPDCGEKIIVRKRNGQPVLLSAVQDAERKANASAVKHREKFLRRANRCGATDEEFAATEAALTDRFGSSADPADVFWAIANERVVAGFGAGEWHIASTIYGEQAEHLAETGRPWQEVARQRASAMVRQLQSPFMEPETTMRVAASCKCGVCQADSRRELTFAQALADPTLPHIDCQRPPCKCWLYEKRDPSGEQHVISMEVPLTLPQQSSGKQGFFKRVFGGGR